MSVTSLLISLHDTMLSVDAKLLWECIVKCFDHQYCGEQRKDYPPVSGVPTLFKNMLSYQLKATVFYLFIFKVITDIVLKNKCRSWSIIIKPVMHALTVCLTLTNDNGC